MRFFYALSCFVGVMMYHATVQAYPMIDGNNLSTEGLRQEASAKRSSPYVKYAAINFLPGSNSKDIKPTLCPEGEKLVKGRCLNVSSCKEAFPLTSVNKAIGTYITKDCGDGNQFCYISCATGWIHDGCSCTKADCSGFPFDDTKDKHCDGVKGCKTGDNLKYKCTSCETGYSLGNDGKCNKKSCDTGYYSSITDNCIKVDTAKTGEDFCYKCTACKSGYTLNTSTHKCDAVTCSHSTSTIDHCIAYESASTAGDGLCFKCKTCADGYDLNSTGTSCDAKSCATNYKTGMDNLLNCVSASTHLAGENYCHKCDSCAENYGLDTDHCYQCTWNGYVNKDACPNNCVCGNSDTCGGHTYYEVTAAAENYYVSGTTSCSACTWDGYTIDTASSACPSNCNCNTSTCGGHTKRSEAYSAADGYYLSNGQCPKCPRNGYSNTSCPKHCTCNSDVCSGTTYYSNPTGADDGYELKNGSCPAKSCPTNYSTDQSYCDNCVSGACQTAKSGDSTCYFCASCATNFMQSGSGCKALFCDALGNPSQWHGNHNNCSSYETKKIYMDNECYRCSACNSGYTLNSTTKLCEQNQDTAAEKCLSEGYAVFTFAGAHCNMTDSPYGVNYPGCPHKYGMYKCTKCASGDPVTITAKGNGSKSYSVSLCLDRGSNGASSCPSDKPYRFTGSCYNKSYFENALSYEIKGYGY